jgi:predicted RNase H-like HicB family nuclease
MIVGPMDAPDTRQRLQVRVREEEGAFWATVDEFPGVFATGDDLDELRESILEGISLLLAKPGEEPPALTLSELHATEVATAELAPA